MAETEETPVCLECGSDVLDGLQCQKCSAWLPHRYRPFTMHMSKCRHCGESRWFEAHLAWERARR